MQYSIMVSIHFLGIYLNKSIQISFYYKKEHLLLLDLSASPQVKSKPEMVSRVPRQAPFALASRRQTAAQTGGPLAT